jgi:hypothetical protein
MCNACCCEYMLIRLFCVWLCSRRVDSCFGLRPLSVIVIMFGLFEKMFKCVLSVSYLSGRKCMFVWYDESVFLGMLCMSNFVF